MRDAGCLPYVTGKSSLIDLVKTQFFYRERKTEGRNVKIFKELRRRCGGKFKVKAFFKNSNSVTTANNCEKF